MKPQYATLVVEIAGDTVNDSGIPCIPATTKVRITPCRVRVTRPGCPDLCYGKAPDDAVSTSFINLHEIPSEPDWNDWRAMLALREP